MENTGGDASSYGSARRGGWQLYWNAGVSSQNPKSKILSWSTGDWGCRAFDDRVFVWEIGIVEK